MQRQSRNQKKKGKDKKEKRKEKEEENNLFEDIVLDESTPKDFTFFANAPISEDDHFIFKSEKSWNVDVSKYSEYFSIDLNTLSAAIESIPFNENIMIDQKYFSNDQLTQIYNTAKKGKEDYEKIIQLSEERKSDKTNSIEQKHESLENITEDLDFLLALQEPVTEASIIVKPLPTPTRKLTVKSPPTKTMDLEKWLDSVLEF